MRFYQELFGMEEILAPDFPFPVRWMRLGNLQLHLFHSDETAPLGHHFGVDVDDFEVAYEKAGDMEVRKKEGYFSHLYEIPDGAVQMYLRDPARNMVEVSWPDVSTLDHSVVTEEIHKIEVETSESARVTLYL